MKYKTSLSAERLRYLLDYDPNTGIFIWSNPPSRGPVRPGDLATTRNYQGYIRIKIDGSDYRAHRLAWLYHYGEWPGGEIDHINHIRDDNRIANLRITDRSGNRSNSRLPDNNKSGVCGVFFHEERQKWYASIGVNNTTIFLGRYTDKEKAIEARMRASKEHGFHPNHGAIEMPGDES